VEMSLLEFGLAAFPVVAFTQPTRLRHGSYICPGVIESEHSIMGQ
jgi:hypothetical protein